MFQGKEKNVNKNTNDCGGEKCVKVPVSMLKNLIMAATFPLATIGVLTSCDSPIEPPPIEKPVTQKPTYLVDTTKLNPTQIEMLKQDKILGILDVVFTDQSGKSKKSEMLQANDTSTVAGIVTEKSYYNTQSDQFTEMFLNKDQSKDGKLVYDVVFNVHNGSKGYAREIYEVTSKGELQKTQQIPVGGMDKKPDANTQWKDNGKTILVEKGNGEIYEYFVSNGNLDNRYRKGMQNENSVDVLTPKGSVFRRLENIETRVE
jgi:hypothetical protein